MQCKRINRPAPVRNALGAVARPWKSLVQRCTATSIWMRLLSSAVKPDGALHLDDIHRQAVYRHLAHPPGAWYRTLTRRSQLQRPRLAGHSGPSTPVQRHAGVCWAMRWLFQ